MAVPPAPVRVPSQSPPAPSVASVMSVVNDKGNEMILGAVHRSPGIAEDNLSRPSGEGTMRPVIASNGVPLQMRSVGSHSTPGRGMQWFLCKFLLLDIKHFLSVAKRYGGGAVHRSGICLTLFDQSSPQMG